jgi:hypothetical protein
MSRRTWWRLGRPNRSQSLEGLEGLPFFTGAELFANLQGGFCPPQSADGNGVYFDFGPKHGMAYRSSTGGLFVPNRFNQVSEWNVPALVTGSTTASFNYSGYNQPHTPDASEGKDNEVDLGGGEPANTSAVLVHAGKLVGSLVINYDNANSGLCLYTRPLSTTDTGNVVGVDGIIDAGKFRFFSKAFCDIPVEWQEALGGPVMGLAGSSYSIISTQSMGPSCASFDPADIDGDHGHVPGTMLVGYPDGHRELGTYDDWPPPSEFYNFSMQVLGGFIPDGTRNMVFLGSMGARDSIYAGYGTGTSNIAEHGTLYPNPVTGPFMICYDPPYAGNSGGHCWPYKSYAWIYDLWDMKRVKDGDLDPWELRPVEMFDMDSVFPITITDVNALHQARGGAWDKANRHVYISQEGAGCIGNNGAIWVFQVPGTTP